MKTILLKLRSPLLLIAGAILILIGTTIVAAPTGFYAANGIEVGANVSLLNELKAPAGFLLAAGLFIVAAAFVEALAQRLYQRQIPWVTAMQQLYAHYQRSGDSTQALKVALILADALPYLENPQSVAGQLLVNRGRYPQALRYLKRATELAPDNANNLLALGRVYLFGGRKTDAERVLRRLLQLDPDHAMARRLLAQVE